MTELERLEAEMFGMTSTISEKPAVLTMDTLQAALDMMRDHEKQEEKLKAAFLKLSAADRMAAIWHAQEFEKDLPHFCRNTARLLWQWHDDDTKANPEERT